MNIKHISDLPIPNWHKIAKAIYSASGIAPCVHTCGGGNMKPMILEKKHEERDKSDNKSAN